MSRNISDMTSETGMDSSAFGLPLTKPVMLFASFVPELEQPSVSVPVQSLWSPQCLCTRCMQYLTVLIQALRQKKTDVHVSGL